MSEKAVTVWRLECAKTGRGVYMADIVDKCPAVSYDFAGHRPMIMEEGAELREAFFARGGYKKCHKFGFVSQKQMLRWFSAKDIRTMQRHGAVITKYRVPAAAVLASPTQCMFNIDQAERVAT